ncbi:MAG: protein-glutamate O-methyltransferase [Deltaproteobacteria bacterium]|nr:protein-glutamate O-methyltransferase [Deltaproteobacteria bacterium]
MMFPEISEIEYALYVNYFYKLVGITLPDHKRSGFGRKLAARMEALGIPSYASFFRYIRTPQGAGELATIVNHVTIDQSRFFRGEGQLAHFADVIVPGLALRQRSTRKLRIWSAGCSRGQEPYTVAMILAEKAREVFTWDFKILATDVDSDSLKTASLGIYGAETAGEVAPELLSKYFSTPRGKPPPPYRVKAILRNRVSFRKLNLMNSPYPIRGPFQVILCRNVMIYFDAATRKNIVSEFHRLLADDGYLFLGGTESLFGVDDRFTLVGQAVYRKNCNGPANIRP